MMLKKSEKANTSKTVFFKSINIEYSFNPLTIKYLTQELYINFIITVETFYVLRRHLFPCGRQNFKTLIYVYSHHKTSCLARIE